MPKSVNKPIRLYIDASPLAEDKITGIPHFTAELVKALCLHPDCGKTFKVLLVIAFDKKKKLARWDYPNASTKIIPIPLRLFNLVWKYNLLPWMDILLGEGVYLFPNYKNWPLRKSNSLTYIHDLGFIRFPEYVQPKNLEFLKNNIQKWISRSSLVLTGSEYTRKEIIKLLKVPSGKIVSIHHGVNHNEYYPRKPKEIESVKQKYNINEEYIIYIGSLEPRKNLSRLINAYCKLPKKLHEHYAMCLVGSAGWLNDDILENLHQAQQNAFNIITPSRYVEDKDLPSLISGAVLLVHPALYEGFGLSPLQAMACGTPVVVANNSSLPEVVGNAGLFVNAESVSDISAKLEAVLTNVKHRQVMIADGLKQANKFGWDKSAQLLLDCINELVS